jgi:hypothetical protein
MEMSRDARVDQRLARGIQSFAIDDGSLFAGLSGNEAQQRAHFATLSLAAPAVGALPRAGSRRDFLQALAQDAAFNLK